MLFIYLSMCISLLIYNVLSRYGVVEIGNRWIWNVHLFTTDGRWVKDSISEREVVL